MNLRGNSVYHLRYGDPRPIAALERSSTNWRRRRALHELSAAWTSTS